MSTATTAQVLDFQHVRLTLEGSVAILTLNHVEVLNSISSDMLQGINAAMDVVTDPARDIRSLLLTGEGRAFCTGANLQGRKPSAEGKSSKAGSTLETEFHPTLRRFRDLHCPIVAAVNGPCAGAGMSFAMLGDLIYAARSSYFLQAFRRIGLVPDCGATWMLPRLVGRARAMELSLLGEKLPAETAAEWGIVNKVLDDDQLMPEALKLARTLAEGPTVALSLTRRLYWDSPSNSFEEQLDAEARAQRQAGASADFSEGVSAFLQKRPAQFKGR